MNTKKKKNNTSQPRYAILLTLALLLVTLIPTVSAFEFDNVKTYDPITREFTVTNAFGLGADIGKVRLNTPILVIAEVSEDGEKSKVGEFDLWAYQDYNDIIKSVKLYNKNYKDWKNYKLERDYELKYKTYQDVKVDDYKYILTGYEKNGTAIWTSQKVEFHYEYKEVWIKLTPASLKKNEMMTIGVFTEVKKGDRGEWVAEFFGVECWEWAGWTENLQEYWIGTPDDENSVCTIYSAGQTFTVGSVSGQGDFTLNKISIKMFRTGSPGNIVVRIKATDGSNDPTGSDISTGTFNGNSMTTGTGGEFYNATMTDVDLIEGETYFIYATALDGTWSTDRANWKKDRYDGGYGGGVGYVSGDNITTWSIMDSSQTDFAFKTWGSGRSTDSSPNITLNSPSSANHTTVQNLQINFTAYDDINLSDVKLYVNTALNQTNASGLNNSLYLFDLALGDGTYTIYGKATDNSSQETSTSSITIFIDTIKPTFNIISPTTQELTSTLPLNITLNVTTTDTNLNLCWYYTSENSTNITYTCNTTTNISYSSGGYKTIYVFANDTLGNTNGTKTTFLLNYIQEDTIYEDPIIEKEINTIVLNITASEINSINATLHYNGTNYATTLTNQSTTFLLTTILIAPLVNANTLVYLNWSYNLNGVDYNSSGYNQTIYIITPINITSADCVHKALRFDIKDEKNSSALYGDVEYNFKYGISNNTLKEIYGSLTNVTTFYICINASVSENYNIGYGEIQYRDNGYVDRRYYIFKGQILSNNTLTNRTLKDLFSADQTSFLLTMEDTSLNVYEEKYTALWRWYPDFNEYQIVEMGKTDEYGQTVAHIETEDVDYRVGLYETDGTLIKLGDPLRFLCTSAPCSFTLRVGAGDVDYSSFFNVQADISYNETTGMFTLIYNDPNQYTSEMRFLVTRETGTDTLIICNDTSSGFTGVMSCNTSMYTGLKKAVAYRSASPPIIIAQKIVSELNTVFNSSFGLFISVFLWLAIVLSGFGNNPIWVIILSVVGLIPALLMGSINVAIFTGIVVLSALIIHFIKRSAGK